MQQGWIEWAKVCKLTILHDLATFLPGVLIITMSSVDIVMMRGVCFISYVLQTLSKPCLSLSFAFIWKAKCLLLLLPPCHDQDHFHTAWGWDNPYTLPPHPTPPHPTLPSPSFVPLPQLFISWYDFFSSLLQTKSSSTFFSHYLSCLLTVYLNLRWFALCERSVCLRIFPPIECYETTVADFQM